MLRDTKNRTDHTLLLSKQALAIVKHYAKGKKPADKLFSVVDARKTLEAINTKAATTVKPHGQRATFASVAEELVSAYTRPAACRSSRSAAQSATTLIGYGRRSTRL